MGIVNGALKASRADSDKAYRSLTKMINALILVDGETDYADFIDYVNTTIKHYKQEVIYRRTSISLEEKTDNNQ